MSAKALISSALPDGSRKNIVACSPGSPLKRMYGSITNSMSRARRRAANASHSDHRQHDAEMAYRHVVAVDRVALG